MSVERNHEMRAFGIRRDRLYAEHLPARMPSLYLLGYVWTLHVFLAFCIWPAFGAFALHVSTSEPIGPFLVESATAQRFGAIERVRA